MTERFAICPCEHCGKNIEFDRSQLSEGETQKVECPHCQLETTLFIPMPAILPINYPVKRKRDTEKPSIIMLQIGCALMFIVGTGMSILGCRHYDLEQAREESSAIRQTVCVLQYGLGFVLMALGMILSALIRIIRNK